MNETKSVEELRITIAALENQRSLLGDTVVDTALEPLLEKLAALESTEPAPQKRKQATILFADVAGFTAMAETMDAERVVESINVLWSQLDRIVTAHGGRIDKHIGDAVMALWGADLAREDDPERAIHAALDMQNALVEIERSGPGSGFHMRIGINTGPVLIGRVGSMGEFTAMGDAVNLASRLQDLCPLDGVLIGHDTYRHVRGVFDVQRLEPADVKGKSEPVRSYLVQRAKPRAFRLVTRGIEGIETRMIGRDDELSTLQDAFLHVLRADEAQMVTVIGEAGVGKSRLLYEFDNWIELRPERVVYFKGRSTPAQQRQPFALMRDLFALRFEILESDDLTTVLYKFRAGMTGIIDADSADVIGHWLGFDFSASSAVAALLGAEEFADLASAYLEKYLRGLAADNPVLFQLEDIHWADDRSLDLLMRLGQALSDTRLLTVCLSRPSLFERRPAWGEGSAQFSRIDLKPLPPDLGSELVNEILQKVDYVPDDMRDLIVTNADGNPFYVEELIKSFIDQGIIERGEEHWRIVKNSLGSALVPQTLTALLQARLDSLLPQERDLLQRASVVGRLFWDRTVADLAGSETAEVDPILEAVRRREFIYQHESSTLFGAEEYIFKHALLREVTYETVLLRLRQGYHARIARWLEANTGDRLAEFSGLIAEHYTLAGEFDRASACWERVGDAALQSGDSLSARDALELAIELASSDSHEPVVAPGLGHKLGRSLMRLGEFERAKSVLEDALERSMKSENKALQADVLLQLYWLASRLGNFEEAAKHLTDVLPMTRDVGGKILLEGVMAETNYETHLHNYARAQELADETLILARENGLVNLEATALNNISIIALVTGDLDAAEKSLLASRSLARQVKNPFTEHIVTLNLGNVSYERGDYVTAKQYYETAQKISREMNYLEKDVGILLNLAFADMALGDLEAAWESTQQALVQSVQMKLTPAILYALIVCGQLSIKRNDLEKGLALFGLVRDHPAVEYDALHDIERFLGELDLDEADITAGLEGAAGLQLETVIAELLES